MLHRTQIMIHVCSTSLNVLVREVAPEVTEHVAFSKTWLRLLGQPDADDCMLQSTHKDTCGNEQVLKLTLLVLTSLTFYQLGHFPSYIQHTMLSLSCTSTIDVPDTLSNLVLSKRRQFTTSHTLAAVCC